MIDIVGLEETDFNESSDGEWILFIVPQDLTGQRLDKVLARLMPEYSRNRIQHWITNGHVLQNHKVATVSTMVHRGDQLEVQPQVSAESTAYKPEFIPLQVIAQTDEYLVINKPAGLVVHPGAGNWSGTLLNGLLFAYPELLSVARAGIVHRLDKDTSGLMVVARSETAQTALVRQLQARTVKREYIALVHGHLNGAGILDSPIGRDRRVPTRMTVNSPIAPKQALTHYVSLQSGYLSKYPVTRVVCRLETGRTHQIRVHLSNLGHPLVADSVYGGQLIGGAMRQQLHAQALAFNDPVSHQLMQFQENIPEDMQAIINLVKWIAE